MATYTIGQAAERSGFTASALRFYERHGVVEPVARTDAGYRLYDDASLDRLEFVARAKQLGCTLEEIGDLARLWDGDDCGPVQHRLHELVTDKLVDARTRTAELQHFTAQLHAAATRLDSPPVDGPCHEGCACATAARPGTDADTVARRVEVAPPIACSLPVDELPERLDGWRSALAGVVDRTPIEGGLRLAFGSDTDLAELAALIAAEQSCCAFFAFALTVDGRGTALEVRAPAEGMDLVASLFGTRPEVDRP